MGCYLNGSGGSRVNASVTHRNQATAVLQGGGGGSISSSWSRHQGSGRNSGSVDKAGDRGGSDYFGII